MRGRTRTRSARWRSRKLRPLGKLEHAILDAAWIRILAYLRTVAR